MKKKLAILGSTGSIGTQTLDVIRHLNKHGHEFKVHSLAVKGREDFEKLAPQIDEFKPEKLCIFNEKDADTFPFFNGEIMIGNEGLIELSKDPEIGAVVVSVVGAVGIEATVEGLKTNKRVCIATKEVLVAAGDIIMGLANNGNGELLPIDSEHSAILQCLNGEGLDNIKKIHITASGGALRNWSPKRMKNATREDVLKHPNWDMGAKITVDSATMMNKGLEIIEAHHLYSVPFEKIDAVIHPQSFIHSFVEYCDGSMIAQMGKADMRLPIQYALTYPERYPSLEPETDFDEMISFKLKPMPGKKKFPCFYLALEAGKIGGTMPAVMNAANEIAVYAFLNKKIGFGDIPIVVKEVMGAHKKYLIKEPTLDEILAIDIKAREFAEDVIFHIQKDKRGIKK